MKHYYHLKEGETIREGDEVEVSSKYNDPAKWIKATHTIGQKAPNPNFIAHRLYRRELTLENYWAANSSDERTRIIEKTFKLLSAISANITTL